MIEHLAYLNDTFPGAANQTCCFIHILNLVAKSVLQQFETPKVKGIKAINNNDDNGLPDEQDELSEEELSSLEESVKPIHLILMKVSHFN